MQKDVVLTPDIGLMLQCEECMCLDLNVGNNLSVDFFNKH